jgi:hypothetical protein
LALKYPSLFSKQTGARKRRVRQPGDRDVVEDVVAREASDCPSKTRDELMATRVVIKNKPRPTSESTIPYNVWGRNPI